MKHIKTINELFASPKLTRDELEQMIQYLKDYAAEKGYEVYEFPLLDITSSVPGYTEERRFNKEDPYGEEDWDANKPKIMSGGFKLFDGDDAVLGFRYTSNGTINSNELFIDYSSFNNIDFKLLAS